MPRSRDLGNLAPVRTLLSLPDLTSLSLWGQRRWTQVYPKQADSPPRGDPQPWHEQGGTQSQQWGLLAFCPQAQAVQFGIFFPPSLMFYSCKSSLNMSSEEEREDVGEGEIEELER